jgi:hypothetical protein
MDKKWIEKEIDHQRDMKNNIWTAFIVVAGGTMTLMVSPYNNFKGFLIIVGFILSAALFIGYFNKQDTISHLINKLKG